MNDRLEPGIRALDADAAPFSARALREHPPTAFAELLAAADATARAEAAAEAAEEAKAAAAFTPPTAPLGAAEQGLVAILATAGCAVPLPLLRRALSKAWSAQHGQALPHVRAYDRALLALLAARTDLFRAVPCPFAPAAQRTRHTCWWALARGVAAHVRALVPRDVLEHRFVPVLAPLADPARAPRPPPVPVTPADYARAREGTAHGRPAPRKRPPQSSSAGLDSDGGAAGVDGGGSSSSSSSSAEGTMTAGAGTTTSSGRTTGLTEGVAPPSPKRTRQTTRRLNDAAAAAAAAGARKTTTASTDENEDMDSAGTRVKEEEEDEEEENEEEEGETTGERSGAAGTTTPTTTSSSSSSGGPVLCTFCGAEIRPSFKRYKYRAMEREGGGAPVERIGGRPCLIGRRAVLASTFVCAECYKRNEQLVRRPEPPPPLSARRLSSTRTAAQRTASASADDGEGEEGEEQEEDGDENRDGSEDGKDDSNKSGAQGEDDENEGDEGEEEEKEKKAGGGGGDDHEGREPEPEEQEGESETEGHGMTREERGRRQVEQLQLLVAAGLHREAARAAPEDALCRYVARALATFRWTLTDAGLVSARQRRAHRRRPALPAAVHAALTARSPALRLVPRDTPAAASSTDSAPAPLTWALHCLFFPSFPFPLPFLFHFFFSPHMPSHPPFPIPPQQRP